MKTIPFPLILIVLVMGFLLLGVNIGRFIVDPIPIRFLNICWQTLVLFIIVVLTVETKDKRKCKT